MIITTFVKAEGALVPQIKFVGSNKMSPSDWASLIYLLKQGIYAEVLLAELAKKVSAQDLIKIGAVLGTYQVGESPDDPIIPIITDGADDAP